MSTTVKMNKELTGTTQELQNFRSNTIINNSQTYWSLSYTL